MLVKDFHRDPMTKIMGLERRIPDQPTVGLTEPPDVLAFHRLAHGALSPQAEGRPEQRRVGRYPLNHNGWVLGHVAVEVLQGGGWQGNIAGVAALHEDVSEAPFTVKISDSERGDRLTVACRNTAGSGRPLDRAGVAAQP